MVEVGIFCWPEEAMRVVIEKTFTEEVESTTANCGDTNAIVGDDTVNGRFSIGSWRSS